MIDGASLWVAEVAVVYAAWTVGLVPLTERELAEGLGWVLAVYFWAFPAWPYFALFESATMQGTPGKWLLGLRVTDREGGRIGWVHATARHWLKLLSLPLFVGGFIVALTTRKQGLHDLVAGTVVWRREASRPAERSRG